MIGDGNGWTRCGHGHRHWGRFGAAGLLVVRRRAERVEVLLQKRAASTESGTWAIPGGAQDSHETPVQAALREAAEEAGISAADVRVTGVGRDDHGGWRYVTVIAAALSDLELRGNVETAELRWVQSSSVSDMKLHPGFAQSWPRIRSAIERMKD